MVYDTLGQHVFRRLLRCPHDKRRCEPNTALAQPYLVLIALLCDTVLFAIGRYYSPTPKKSWRKDKNSGNKQSWRMYCCRQLLVWAGVCYMFDMSTESSFDRSFPPLSAFLLPSKAGCTEISRKIQQFGILQSCHSRSLSCVPSYHESPN